MISIRKVAGNRIDHTVITKKSVNLNLDHQLLKVNMQRVEG